MRRLIVLSLLLVAPAAHAAPLVERPYLAMPDRQVATCLRATGTPGGLALYATSGTALLDGTTRAARVRLGRLVDCVATATAGGAAVVAAPVRRERRAQVRVALRDPGGGFGAPVTLGSADPDTPSVAAAVSPAGDAIVAWLQRRGGGRHRVVAARRAAGGTFGPVEPLSSWRRAGEFSDPGAVAAAMAADGHATVAWALPIRHGRDVEGATRVATAHAAAGGPFSRQSLAGAVHDVSRVALAVAPDGWALLAYDERAGMHVLERAPGAARFTGVFQQRTSFSDADAPVVAVRDGGGGVAAWRSGFGEDAGVVAMARPATGAFTAPRPLASDTAAGNGASIVATSLGGPPIDSGNGALRAALAGDGRALLAWTSNRRGVIRPRVSAGTLAAGFGEPARLGSPIRDVNGVAPLFLADGRAALAWTDNVTEYAQFAIARGRLHLAAESEPPPAAPEPPRVALTAPRRQRLYAAQPVRVRVGCDRACDLRVTLAGHGTSQSTETRSLTRARTIDMRLLAFDDRRRRSDRRWLRIRVQATAPNGHEIARATRRVLVVQRPALPVPALLDVRAVRRGGSIVVSWRTSGPARRVFFYVLGQRTRRTFVYDERAYRFVRGRGRSRFRVRLRPDRPASIRWITVQLFSPDAGRLRYRTVRVG